MLYGHDKITKKGSYMVYACALMLFLYVSPIVATDEVSIGVQIARVVDGKPEMKNLRMTIRSHHTIQQLYTTLTKNLGYGELVLHDYRHINARCHQGPLNSTSDILLREISLMPTHSKNTMQEIYNTFCQGHSGPLYPTGTLSDLAFVFCKFKLNGNGELLIFE
jgi:hypothetical protein